MINIMYSYNFIFDLLQAAYFLLLHWWPCDTYGICYYFIDLLRTISIRRGKIFQNVFYDL